MSDQESSDDDIDFTEHPTGYLYEPEYTDEELLSTREIPRETVE